LKTRIHFVKRLLPLWKTFGDVGPQATADDLNKTWKQIKWNILLRQFRIFP